MPVRFRGILLAFTFLAICTFPRLSSADPVAFCTTGSVSVARFGPCTFDGKLFSDFTARVGSIDVSDSLHFSLSSLINEFPTEPLLLPVFGYPAPGHLPAVTPETPLVLGFTVTALDGSAPLSAADLMLRNFFEIPLGGTVATALTFPNGTSTTFGVDAANPVAHVTFAPVPSLGVQITVTGMAEREGAAVGFYAVSDAAPVPEPATLSLIGLGLAVAARARKRKSGADARQSLVASR